MLCDEQAEAGGSLLSEPASAPGAIEGRPAAVWLAAQLAALAANPRVRLLTRTTAFGYFPHNLLGLSERLTDHLAAARGRCAARAAMAGAGARGGARHRQHRAAAGVCRQ